MEGKTREDDPSTKELTHAPRKWEDMSRDCLVQIFERVGIEALACNVSVVCKSWYNASLDPHCWKNLDFDLQYRRTPIYEFVKFAVNRSKGMATDVVLPRYLKMKWDIIQLISEGCPGLRSLSLPDLDEQYCFPKLIQKWKDLETLKMFCTLDFKEILTQVIAHCKNFAALTIHDAEIEDEQVSVIVTLLPNIKYLSLSGSYLPREDLILIISKCKELESLDVSCCIGFDEDDAEISEMASHIKCFKTEGSTRNVDWRRCAYYDVDNDRVQLDRLRPNSRSDASLWIYLGRDDNLLV